jgi:hypothetical protein
MKKIFIVACVPSVQTLVLWSSRMTHYFLGRGRQLSLGILIFRTVYFELLLNKRQGPWKLPTDADQSRGYNVYYFMLQSSKEFNIIGFINYLW